MPALILSSSHPPQTDRPELSRRWALPSISRASEFALGLKQRPQARSAHFALYVVPVAADAKTPVLGLVIPKRSLRLANDRNRVKRVVREVFRLQQMQLYPANWIVRLVKTPGWAKEQAREFRHNCRAEIETLLKQALARRASA